MTSSYDEVYGSWRKDPEGFWMDQASGIDWFEKPKIAFDPDQGVYGRWFPDGVTNTCHNCLDRHVEGGRGDQAAIIYDSPITGAKRTISYSEMLADVEAFSGALSDRGIRKGDRVIIYMPMVPEALVAMLACARLGAVHSVVFGGFAASELATRIEDCEAKLVVSASCGIEPGRIVAYKPLLDAAIEQSSHKPDVTIILQREEHRCELIKDRDFDFHALLQANAGRKVTCTPVASTDPLYVLYTSGTTGQPKGVVRDNGGHMAALHWSMHSIYGVKPGEVFWAASDIGWVVGHSYIVYGPLLHGNTTILFEGKPVGTPDAGTFWRVIDEHNVVVLFTAPTAFRAIRKEDPQGSLISDYDLSGFCALFLAGERADPDTIQWAERLLKVPVIDHWWQTETGWTIAGNPMGLGLLPIKHGSPAVPMPGYDVQVIDDAGHPVAAGTLGNIVVKLPLPPGCLPTLWNADDRFQDAYLAEFPGYYKTADAGFIDDNGYLFIMARTDDIINVAGHRLSTGGMEEAVSGHPDVAECAVIGIADSMKGQIPAGFIVINSGVDRSDDEIEKEVVKLVRDKIGPVAAFKTVMAVKRLPKTRSGKILRATMQKIADGESWKMPATIDDPAILDEVSEVLAKRGLKSRDS
ncbi:Acyl-coenzyme A synthetase/AMP-(fatty) acid ligase [Hoeflea phototrophica DFL-43]|uniref:Acyl-coenzyme A synthetase/AMP-(Fatty) acid ligase n=1 Tax=Hoeflea phototrophica (strain DSM 17068 / NCIMB 14078 / DFL-43) TaxID=411684 RepID=A9CUN4_HOEPD|nr:propionyl-CoA synthetase [Hoeflea phototrophica]EDQ35240.1 Acyl-coenzyme A synthetase/AMP-(fatty) acid ligase [Hoeflea phototrophica DFL-43]